MRILVIGASGLVGSHVLAEAMAQGHTTLGTYRNFPVSGLVKLDLGDETATGKLFADFKPDWVVHAAGWTWVDGCEKDPERAYRENCEQPVMVARICKQIGSRFAYFSTTYVFDGTAGPYSEDDKPNPINFYGKSKWEAEQSIQNVLGGGALIPRVICVWGKEAQKKNFVYQVINALRDHRTLTLPSDQIGNPTWAGDVASWLIKLMERSLVGIWHLAGDQFNCTRVDWFYQIRSAAQIMGLVPRFNVPVCAEVATPELNQPALRPLNAGAVTRKLIDTLEYNAKPPCILGVLKL